MRPPKTVCWIVLVAMLPQLTGCRSFYPVEGETLANVHPSRVVRVTSVGGSSVDLRCFYADSEMVGGIPIDEGVWIWVEIPTEDVDVIEAKRLNAGITLILFGAILGLFVWGAQDLVDLGDWNIGGGG